MPKYHFNVKMSNVRQVDIEWDPKAGEGFQVACDRAKEQARREWGDADEIEVEILTYEIVATEE